MQWYSTEKLFIYTVLHNTTFLSDFLPAFFTLFQVATLSISGV